MSDFPQNLTPAARASTNDDVIGDALLASWQLPVTSFNANCCCSVRDQLFRLKWWWLAGPAFLNYSITLILGYALDFLSFPNESQNFATEQSVLRSAPFVVALEMKKLTKLALN